MDVLVVDVGGTNVKVFASDVSLPRKFASGRDFTPGVLMDELKKVTADWRYDVVSVGLPAPVLRGALVAEPQNLAPGWVGFDFPAAFDRPVKLINDAAMQALGSYNGGRMLFLGLGTGLGSTLVADGAVCPLELGRLPYRRATFEDYVGRRGLLRLGKQRWRRHVAVVVRLLTAAFVPDEVVLGGGNAKKLVELPPLCRIGRNANAFAGGLRLWEDEAALLRGPALSVVRGEEERKEASL